MKGKNSKKTVDKTEGKSESKEETKNKEEKKKLHFCKDCKFYDRTTERKFHRDGIRKGLVEIRAVCRNPKARSCKHLVKAEYKKRRCSFWEEGKYEPPKKKETKTEKKKGETVKVEKPVEQKMNSPEEYFGIPEDRVKEQSRSRK